jgi:multidrug efflux system outer membrane protein
MRLRAIDLAPAFLALATAGCTLGPNYLRPAVALPDQFRGASAPAANASLADRKWVDLFQDEVLRQLVSTALEHNFDVRIAAERVLEARAQLGITRANQFPLASGQVGFTTQGTSKLASGFTYAPGTNLKVSYTSVVGTVTWDADLWGRLRRLTEQARAQYLASDEGRRAVIVSLVGDVMSAYFSLIEQDLEYAIAAQTRDVANNSLRLTQIRHDRGAASSLDIYQARQLLFTATSQIASTQRQIGETEDALSLLTGAAPHEIIRTAKLEQIPLPPELPAGLPSGLLTRRPDILQAEQNLIAANAQIGAVRASYFPDISLTAFFGQESRELTNLLTAPARAFSVAPSTLFPIFRAGQIKSAIRLTEAQEREALLDYQKTIYAALRDVSDALIDHDRTRDQRAEEEKLVNALSETVRVATMRYQGGLDSYLQVLDAQRDLFQGQLTLSQLRLQEVLSVVQLYRALGGGWQ